MNIKKNAVKKLNHTDNTIGNQAAKESIKNAAWRSIDVLKERFSLSLNDMQILLGGIPLIDLKQGLATEAVELDDDAIQRVSALLAIYKRLRLLFDHEERAYTWIDRPNSLAPFNGVTPRTVMLSGHYEDLVMIAAFLDSFTRLTQADDLDG